MKSLKAALQAILYVLVVLGLHLLLIYLLKIKIEGWGTEVSITSLKVYFIPLLFCLINSFLLIRTQRIKYHIIWFLVTIVPSFLSVLFFKAIQTSGDYEQAFVTINFFPKYQAEMLFLLPWGISITQFILSVYYVIKLRKDVKLLKA
ncbi:hypothetical protein HQN87_31380 [Paenibacillus tritici]|uniref:Uncharacterized protein n=1 Tax=Paenibacillus tritici TaxID=1873425 RepID=A0ABX2DZH6_9BACL|nr:hypothetical protein [Paenibacillus tritici]NQX49805.1 hypothetical protein [Paenibacillus tritici]